MNFAQSKISVYFSEISLLVLIFQLCNLGNSEPHYASSFCINTSGSYTSNSQYRRNLSRVFSNLTSEASLKGFSNFTSGEGVDRVYGIYYCRGDLKLADCQACVETAISRILYECPNEKEAIVFFEECTLRYANRSIFSLEEEDPNDWSYSQAMVSDRDQFNDVLTAAMSGPINQAAFNSSDGFATAVTRNDTANQTVYCLAQCTPDILGTPCQQCLVAALGNLIDEGRTRMSLFMPSCQVMYSLAPFFNTTNATTNYPGVGSPPNSPSSQVSRKSQRHSRLYIGVGVAGALGLLLILFGLWFWMRRRIARQKNFFKGVKGQDPKFQHSMHNKFTYKELCVATENFSSVNLLGQGGFGYVHKGVLPDGKEIAVKQLKTGSLQGDSEFQAEVETISRVHHRHLVSLVGHCISKDQRILVYEFVPNKTLEFHLHEGIPPLSWETRLKIALGAAKGLAYLHEDCHPKIIHRDIKTANILIDSEFEAKVADFGLAKFSSDTDTHVTTRVMGTFGYLAPDYAASGKLNEKSDVFSFGVLLLEIITGRKPVDRLRPYIDGSMVEWARPLLIHYLEGGSSIGLLDARLEDYNPFEMTQMIACAAACIRASAKERPRMSQVVQVLEGNLSADDLLKECIQDNETFHGSSDRDSNIQSSKDLRESGRIGLETQEHSTGEYSGLVGENGVNASTSSTENQQKTQEISGR